MAAHSLVKFGLMTVSDQFWLMTCSNVIFFILMNFPLKIKIIIYINFKHLLKI